MRGHTLTAALTLALSATALGAQSLDPGSLEIAGTSTVRDWSCSTVEFQASMEPESGFEDGVMAGQPDLRALSLVFPIAAIDCGNGKMESHLRKALEADDHPTVTFHLRAYEIAPAGDAVTVQAQGEVTIAGVVRPVDMEVSVERAPDGRLRVRGTQAIEMTDHGVVPPSLMMGTIKVGGQVQVTFDVTLGGAGTTPAGQ